MGIAVKEPQFLDFGNAPELFASGLHSIDVLGPVSRFVFYVERTYQGEIIRQPPFTLIMPNDAVGPSIGLTMRMLGSRVLLPTIARHVVS